MVGFVEPGGAVDGEEGGEVEGEVSEVEGGGEVADGGCLGGGEVGGALEDPLEDAGVFAVAGPEVMAVLSVEEPVDVVDAGEFGARCHLEPVGKVVAHVVAAKGEHGEGIVAEFADFAFGGGSRFGGDAGAEEDAVLPSEGFEDEGDGGAATAAEDDGGDGDALGVSACGVVDGVLCGGDSEAGVGMGRGLGLGI